MTPKERVIKERTVMDKLIAELSELIGQYGVQCSETKILAPTKELADAINRVVAALRQQGEPPTRDAALEEAAPEAPHPDYVQHIVFEGCDCVVLAPEDYEALYIRALRTGPANAQEQQVCEHGKGITDYCQPCGRINGGGNG